MTHLLSAPSPVALLPEFSRASRPVRVFSFGGGVQSTAVLVLQALGKLPRPYDAFVFANVGDDSENPETLEYLERYTRPFAQEHGVTLAETQKRLRDGTLDTLLGLIHRTKRSIPIPLFMGGNGAPGNRACTADFKIRVIDKWIKARGYTHATVGLGISTDEYRRARDGWWHDGYGTRKYGFMRRRDYPLIDLRFNRTACKAAVREAGLPEPPRSSCWFCPFKARNEWIEFKRNQPELFERAVDLERYLNNKRALLGRDRVFMHPSLVPLDHAVGDQLPMFSEVDFCEEGYCAA